MDDDLKDIKASKSFPILTTENYLEWIDIIEDYLRSKGLSKYIEHEPSEKETEISNDSRGVAFIKAYAGDLRTHLIGLRTTKSVLAKLREVCEVSKDERTTTLLSKFYGFKAFPTIDITASKLTQLQLEIGASSPDNKPTDDAKKAMLLQCLSEDYDSTIFALKAGGLSKLSYEEVVQRLRDIEYRMDSTEEVQARFVKGKGTRNGPRKNKNETDYRSCFYCYKQGHFIATCPKRIKDEENNGDTEDPTDSEYERKRRARKERRRKEREIENEQATIAW